MSGLLFNYGGFHAQGTEINGVGVSQEQITIGTIVVANGVGDTPANIIVKRETVIVAGKSTFGLSR